jgi:thiamine-phosphate pyrophosphorylase
MPTETPRLYLITPPIRDVAAFGPMLDAALAVGDIACILLRTDGRDFNENREIISAMAPLAQRREIAVLVADDPELAIRANADGCHLEGTSDALKAALVALQPGRIVGAGGLASRDAAMTAGEYGVDYVMFGGLSRAEPSAEVVERVAWWVDIFNVPCVAYAQSLAGVGDLADAGADFIALGDAVFEDPRGVAAALAEVAGHLAANPARAREKTQ